MRNSAFFAFGLLLILVQTNLYRFMRLLFGLMTWIVRADHDVVVAGATPSLLVPLIIFMGVHEYSLVRGAAVAFALGYVTDLVGIAPIGLFTFASVSLFLLARAAGVRLAAQTAMMQMGLAFAFALAHAVIVLVLLAIFGRDAWVPRSLYKVAIPHVVATAIVAPLIFRLAQRIHAATTTSREQGAGP